MCAEIWLHHIETKKLLAFLQSIHMFVDITAAEEYDIYLYALEANANLTSYSLTFIASSGKKQGGKEC